jgi:hypothetical protein
MDASLVIKKKKKKPVEKKAVEELIAQTKEKSLAAALKSSGYPCPIDNISKPAPIVDYQESEKEFVALLDDRKRLALELLNDGVMRAASARDLAYIADITNKNHLLMTNRETERKGHVVKVRTFGDNDPLLKALQDEQKRVITGEVIFENKEE